MDKILSLAASPVCPAIDFSYPHSRDLYHTGGEYLQSDLFNKKSFDSGLLRLDLPLFVIIPDEARTARLAALLSVSTDEIAELSHFNLALTPDGLVHRRQLADSQFSPENLYGGDAVARMLENLGNADKIPEFLTRVLPIPKKVQDIANDPTADLTLYALSDTAYTTYRLIERYNRVLAANAPALLVHNERRMITEWATKYLTTLSELS